TPMSATAFNKLYNSASQQYSSVQKRTYISNAFASLNNYFTTAQAMKLIVLVNDDASRLFLAKSSFRGITDPENFSNVNSLLYTQSSRNELAVYVSNYNNSNSQTGRVAWTASYFNTIYYTAQQKLPSSTRVSYLAEIFSNSSSYYSVDQAKQLIRLVNGESDRLQLAKSAYRGLSNFSDYTQMNDLFSYQSSRNEFAAYVNSYQSGNPIVYRHLAMADEDFRTLYRNVQNEWLPFAKMQALQGIFNNNDYFFTSTQARQLIQLVSAEANRLALAKLAYGNVVDPENFNQLSDLLSLQASRDELATYVKTYAGIGQ
ncbi:MAG TPA: DUF4476 domain-containing protein, partial [Chitinophagaceae bacterium]|nr:DUF4476 domain-containing protein [Chitinophagaceae bacterium]